MVWGPVIDQTRFRQRQPNWPLAATEDWPPGLSVVLVACFWCSAEISVFEPAGGAAEGDDFGVVD